MTTYGYEERAKAADLFEQGHGYYSAATTLGLPLGCLKSWLSTFNAVGREVFLQMGTEHQSYDYETKLAAVIDFLEIGMTRAEVMEKHGICSLTALKSWARAYRKGGPEALRPKPKGRRPKDPDAPPKPASREEELEDENRRLRAEVAYLKNCAPWRRRSDCLGEMPGNQRAFRAGTHAQGPPGRVGDPVVDLPLQQGARAQADQVRAARQGRRDLLQDEKRMRAQC